MDLLIEIDPDAHLSYFDLLMIKENFSQLLGRSVDMVEKQAIKNPYRRVQIVQTAKLKKYTCP